ncbi:MAG: hypothetical protein PF488_04220 [Patescibacteria group bacterium]|jgi:hypothetical protein|nr:hypothetical protein [Patescibacteria group bacterium]
MNNNSQKLPNLNESLLQALEFFRSKKLNKLNTSSFNFPIVVGSGNAINTGKLLFGKQAALFASESNLKEMLKNYKKLFNKKIIKEAVVISASGEKDSVWEIKELKKLNLKITLLTCSPNSTAAKFADKNIIYSKIPEPYTYNVSTYLGMILSSTEEKAQDIEKYIKKIKLPNNFSSYKAFTFILPDKYAKLAPMLEIKRDELFGSRLSLRAFSEGQARHAKFVIPWEKELVISFGKNKYFGVKNSRLEINLPKNANFGLLFSLTYYIIGLIQEVKPNYFKNNIEEYCKVGPKAYGKKTEFKMIVE